MRSGIGPKDHLEEMGIECVVDLPGVGSNLIDHLVRMVDNLKSEQEILTKAGHLYRLRDREARIDKRCFRVCWVDVSVDFRR